MVSRIFNVDSVGDGYRASLVTGGNALVRATAMVASEDSTAIYGSGSTMVVNVLGQIAGDKSGISLGQAASHHDNRILIGADGYVAGFESAISMIGYSATIENRGSIWSSGTAISMTGNGAGSYTSKITNIGIIEAHVGVQNLGANSLSFKNSGILTADEDSYAYRSTLNSYDKIVNTGTINGNIQLGNGNDTIEGSGTLNGDVSGGGGNDTITIGKGINNISGDGGNDIIFGNGTISGGGGNDTLTGGGNMYGDAGNDIIGSADSGGDSSQKFYGGTGDDIYYASVGYDEESAPQIFESAGEGDDTIYVIREYKLPKNVEVEHLVSIATTYSGYISKLTGNNLAQSITGSAFADVLDGGGGTDKLTGLGGNDTYVVNGSDTVVEAANGGTDLVKSSATYTLAANVENLTLTGSSAINGTGNGLANTIIGNSAANTLSGGVGADILTGGSGADIFLFKALNESTTAAGGQDTITDFIHKQGDVIDLSAIDANNSTSNGNQAFLFKGTAAFSGAKGELRYEKMASDTYIYADVNGDKIADLTIHLDLAVALAAGDFTL